MCEMIVADGFHVLYIYKLSELSRVHNLCESLVIRRISQHYDPLEFIVVFRM